MCGGAGTRLWPLSRASKPKQFHALTGQSSMLQDTVKRVGSGSKHDIAPPSFVCADRDTDLVKRQCEQIDVDILKIVREPMGRNTAPLAAIIALLFQDIDPDGVILLLPADHVIRDISEFWSCVDKGVNTAANGNLVTLGIAPIRPETGYGYIKHGASIDGDVYQVDAFYEKPDLKTAQSYLDAGNFYWNAGIFLFSPQTMIDSFAKHAQETLEACKNTLAKSDANKKSILLHADAFSTCPSNSIDYAIMEKATNVAIVAPVDIGWNDIGSWSELADMVTQNQASSKDSDNYMQIDCRNTYLRSDGPFVAGIGLEDLIIVVEDGKVLIMPKDRSQDVKKIVDHLKKAGRNDLV